MTARTIADHVREALTECGGRSMCPREAEAFRVLADRVTDAGARRLRGLVR